MTITSDPELERLRQDHRSERIPAGLRQRLLERASTAEMSPNDAPPSPLRRARRGLLERPVLALAMMLAALLGVLWWRLPAGEHISLGRVGPEPRVVPSSRATAGELMPSPPIASRAQPRPCPIEELLDGLAPDTFTNTPRPPPGADHVGLSWHTLQLSTRHCGTLPRHFLELVPPGTPPGYRGRVLILIPGMGSPESLAVETRWYFEGLAREKQVVVVYAKALQEPRPSKPSVLVGGWQTDSGAHPEVDDEEYLDRIVLDLGQRGIIGGGNEVWLVGKDNGAAMALAAAARHPERYTGVAAFSPLRLEGLPQGGFFGSGAGRRLKRILFVGGRPDDVAGDELEARAKQWGLALGAPVLPSMGSARVVQSPRAAGSRQIDIGTGENGAPGVRVLALEPGVDPFPPPGGADALSLAASRQRPNALNGAEEVWRYLGGG